VKTRLYDGDTFEVNGRKFKLKLESDGQNENPWDTYDSLGEVVGRRRRNKSPGEVIIGDDGRGYYWFYNVSAAVKKARKEGLNGAKAAEVVHHEKERFRCWLAGLWCYIGVVVTHTDGDGDEYSESVWMIESDDSDGIREVAYDLASVICAQIDREVDAVTKYARMGICTDPRALPTFAQN
jgi:hypothetical protein